MKTLCNYQILSKTIYQDTRLCRQSNSMKRNIIHLPINNSIIKYINNKRAPFQSFSHATRSNSPFHPRFTFIPPYRQFALHSQNMRTRADLLNSRMLRFNFCPTIRPTSPPFYCIVNNPSVKKRGWTKGMDVCTCFHGQRNDENQRTRRSVNAPCFIPRFTIPLSLPRVINRGWPA